MKEKKTKFSLKSELEPSLIEEVSRNWRKLIMLLQVMNTPTRSSTTSRKLLEQNRDLREAHIKNVHEKEELKRVQELRIDEFSRRRLIENQDTIHELTARIQELQNEVNCMNDSRDFKDAESVRSGPSHVPCQPAFFPPFQNPGGMLSRSLWDR